MGKLNRRRDEKGFTIIEVLIATMILSVGMLGVISMVGSGLSAGTIANRVSVGNMLAQSVAEDIISNDSTAFILGSTVTNQPYMLDPVTPSTYVTVPGAGKYSATYSVKPNTPLAGTTQIQVAVSYNPPGGLPVPVGSFVTYKMIQNIYKPL